MEPKRSGPLHPQNRAHAHVVPIFRANDGTPPPPVLCSVPARYLRWGRCGGRAEPTGTSPSWRKKQYRGEEASPATAAPNLTPSTRCLHSFLSLHPWAQPCNPLINPSSPGSVHATHDGGDVVAKRERGWESRRKPPSTQEVASHVPASAPAGGGASLRASRRPRDISQNALRRGLHFPAGTGV